MGRMIRMLTARDRQIADYLVTEKARKAFNDAIEDKCTCSQDYLNMTGQHTNYCPRRFVIGSTVRVRPGVHHGTFMLGNCRGVIVYEGHKAGEHHVRIESGPHRGSVYRIHEDALVLA